MPTKTYGPFTVNKKSVNTRIKVKAGDRIGIISTGEVDFGGAFIGVGAPILNADGDTWQTPPDYPAPDLKKNSLICDVGGKWYQGGVNTSFTPTDDGVLILAPNDKTPEDNSRGWTVTVYHSYPESPGQPVPTPVQGVWRFHTLDGVGGILGPDCGRVPSVVLFNGRQHVFYSEKSGGGNVRHLDYLNSTDFKIEVLDGDGGPNGRTTRPVGYGDILAIAHNNQIHIFYFDMTVDTHGLRHAVFDGQTWQFEYLDGHGPADWADRGRGGRVDGLVGAYGQISAVSAPGGALHLFYWGLTDLSQGPGPDGLGEATGHLRHAWLPASGTWQFEVLDGQGGPNGRIDSKASKSVVGQHSGAMVDQNGRIHVFYGQIEGTEEDVTNLRHAWQDSGMNWQFETLDGRGGPDGRIRAKVGDFPAAISFGNQIHVFYHDETYENVRHCVFDGRSWSFEALDGTGGRNGRVKSNVGAARMAAAKLDDQLSLFYWDATKGNLRHAFWKGVNWQFETLDGEGGTNGRISAVVGWETTALTVKPGHLSVFYHDGASGDLRHAEFF